MNLVPEWEIVIGSVRFKTWMNDGCDYDEKLNLFYISHFIHQPNKFGIHQCVGSLKSQWMLKTSILYKTLKSNGYWYTADMDGWYGEFEYKWSYYIHFYMNDSKLLILYIL